MQLSAALVSKAEEAGCRAFAPPEQPYSPRKPDLEVPVNWNDFTGRVMYGLKQEGKHQFLRDLSRNVARGQICNAIKGYLCGQATPYGYDRMIVDEQGEHRQRIHTGERFSKPRSWRTTLVSSDDAAKTCTVRWLFSTYADTDTGLRSLADQLNSRSVPGPTGGAWFAASIKAILENRNYTGTLTWAKRRVGKHHSVAAGQLRERDRGEVTLSPTGKPHVSTCASITSSVASRWNARFCPAKFTDAPMRAVSSVL